MHDKHVYTDLFSEEITTSTADSDRCAHALTSLHWPLQRKSVQASLHRPLTEEVSALTSNRGSQCAEERVEGREALTEERAHHHMHGTPR